MLFQEPAGEDPINPGALQDRFNIPLSADNTPDFYRQGEFSSVQSLPFIQSSSNDQDLHSRPCSNNSGEEMQESGAGITVIKNRDAFCPSNPSLCPDCTFRPDNHIPGQVLPAEVPPGVSLEEYCRTPTAGAELGHHYYS